MVAGIALAIAVPFIAAPVAGMIFGSTALAGAAGTFGATIGAALTGAGLGAVSGALTAYGTGQNVLMGAAFGGLGGAIGGGMAGYASGVGQAAGAGAAASSGSAALGGGQYAVPASASIGGAAPATVAGQVGMPTGMAAASTAASAGMSATTKAVLEATLKAAPSAIGSIAASIMPSDVGAAAAELQAEMQRLQNSDINAYNKAKMLYDQLYARYQQIDPVAAAQLAEADVQTKTAGLISEVGRTTPRGAASREYGVAAEQRRLAVSGAGEGTNAYTNAYYQGEGAKTQALAGLSGVNPRYTSSSGNYLTSRLNRAEGQQAGLASDVTSFLTPYALALAPKDTTLTSAEADRLRAENDYLNRKYMDKNYASSMSS